MTGWPWVSPWASPRGDFRAVRAGAFTLTAVVLAVLGHGAAMAGTVSPLTSLSGLRLQWAPLTAGFLLVAVVGWLLSRRERGFPAIAAATIAVQAGWHGLLAVGAGGGGPGSRSLSAALLWCHHGASVLPTLPAGTHITGSELVTANPGAAGPTGVGVLAMVAAHALAAFVSSWALVRGERALFAVQRFLDRAASRLPRLPGPVAVTPPRAVSAAAVGPIAGRPRGLLPLLSSARRRGPPVLLTAPVIAR